MKDYLGNKIQVGDEVVFVKLGYRTLMRGVIDRASPSGKTIWISHPMTNRCSTETKQEPSQVMLIKT